MKKHTRQYADKLDAEEAKILSSFEKDEWKSIKDIEKEKVSAQKTATETLRF